MKKSQKKSRENYEVIFEKVREIIFKDWNPLGVWPKTLPKDEYDAYIPVVVGLLLKNKTEKEIADHLNNIGLKNFDVMTNKADLKLLARKLKKIDVNEGPNPNLMVRKPHVIEGHS